MIFITKNNLLILVVCTVFIFLCMLSCNKDREGCMNSSAYNYDSLANIDSDNCEYNFKIHFTHFVDSLEAIFINVSLIYQNTSGDVFSLTKVKYGISDINLFFEDSTSLLLDHFLFIDTENPSPLIQNITDLPALCSGVSFRLGFSTQDNLNNA